MMRKLLAILVYATIAVGQPKQEETWTDPSTGLVWAVTDNGTAITHTQAIFYCQNLALSGQKNWRLPTIDELQRLFGGDANSNGYHIRGPLKLTGWQWSSTSGKEKGEAWALDFGDGGRASAVMGDAGLNRAICVRL